MNCHSGLCHLMPFFNCCKADMGLGCIVALADITRLDLFGLAWLSKEAARHAKFIAHVCSVPSIVCYVPSINNVAGWLKWCPLVASGPRKFTHVHL